MMAAKPEAGRERDGRWQPGHMTDAEIARELAAGTDRREALLAEIAERKQVRAALGQATV